ncbi:MAG: glycosyltransferase family 2 protein [Bryobacteraceae bacterium]|nr:glycosyltransferase family 2 protein [Bryobacteraceae bacterium]
MVPVYNSEHTIPLLLERLGIVLPTLTQKFEVILVNDASRDNSGEVLRRLSRTLTWARTIHLTRNYGQHNALLCGIRAARFDTTVTLDDDLQNPPEELAKLLHVFRSGYDVVYGFPEKETHGLLRNLASRVTKTAFRHVMDIEVASRISSYRVFRTHLRDAFADYRGAFVSIDVLLGWGTSRFAATPVSNPARTLGQTNYTLKKLVAHAMNMMTGFSTLPLQIASLLGFTFAFLGGILLVYVLGRYWLSGGSVPGFPFLASIVVMFSGVQLFSLGIIGEYLARMHFRLMDRPSYTTLRYTEDSNDTFGS